jgi:hypothetical protein
MKMKELIKASLVLCVAMISTISMGEEFKSTFADAKDLGCFKITGPASLDSDVQYDGHPTLKLSPKSQAIWTLRDTDGWGKVSIWVKEDGAQQGSKDRRAGPRWGIVQSDKRALVMGIIYAPYLAGDTTYTVSDSDQKSWFNVQYVAEKRNNNWNNWVFDFDADKGLKIIRNGKEVKRFDWNKTQIKGFNEIALFGDSSTKNPHTIWVGEVSGSLDGAMLAKPTPPPPPPPAIVPEKDEAPKKIVKLKPELEDVHPRLFFTKEDLPSMRAWAKTEEGKAAVAKMESYIGVSNPPSDRKFQKDATDGQRQGIWRAPTAGMYYLITGDEAAKQKALGFMKVFLETENWELGGERDAGMSSANIAVGAALLYDWLYNELDPEFRDKYRDKLLLQARRQYYGGHLNRLHSNGYWQGDPANNHRWHRDAGMTLCLLAVADSKKSDDDFMLEKLEEELAYVDKWLPIDGSTHEGPTYMIFGLQYLVLAMQASDNCLGTDYLSSNKFYEMVPLFMLSSSAPDISQRLAYGDCPATASLGSYGNAMYMCAIANDKADYVEGVKELEKAQPKSFWLGWPDFIWLYQARDMKAGKLENVPTKTIFADVGVVYVRDGWAKDAVASLFKCGPLGGYGLNAFRNENNFKYINVAHDDFDANSFTIFNNGKLTAWTDGYSYQTRSANHNTILVNKTGQMVVGRMKEGYKYNQPGSGDMTKMAVITTFKDFGDVFITEGEASGSYPAVTKGKARPALNQYRRSFIWVEGKYILVFDYIKSSTPADITWMMQGKKLETIDAAKNSYKLVNEDASCTFDVLCTAQTTGEIVTGTADSRGKNLGLKQLQLTANGDKLRFASVFNPWQQKTLTISMEVKNEKQAVITVTGPDFKDMWAWEIPIGKFVPSTIQGKIGSKVISISEKDKFKFDH